MNAQLPIGSEIAAMVTAFEPAKVMPFKERAALLL